MILFRHYLNSFSLFSILCGPLVVYLVEVPFCKLQKRILDYLSEILKIKS
jgi:hypothetical protein